MTTLEIRFPSYPRSVVVDVWWLSGINSVKSVFFVMHGLLIVCWVSFQCSGGWFTTLSTLAFISCLLKASGITRGDRLGPSKVFPRHVIILYIIMAFWVTENVFFIPQGFFCFCFFCLLVSLLLAPFDITASGSCDFKLPLNFFFFDRRPQDGLFVKIRLWIRSSWDKPRG